MTQRHKRGTAADAARDAAPDAALRCPRCGYNLTGLPEPRCPECGEQFDPAQLAAGFARENIQTRLDRCDPWQPHQVLIASLLELLHNAMRPRRVLKRIKLDGPWWSSLWAFAGGFFWIWTLSSVAVAAAIFIHAGASPGAAAKGAGLWFVPRLLACFFVSALFSADSLAKRSLVPGLWHPSQHARVVAHLLPAMMLYVTMPLLVLLVGVPDFVVGDDGFLRVSHVLCLVIPLLGFHAWRAVVTGRRPLSMLPVLIGLGIVGASGFWLIPRVAPTTLDPPIWVYFIGG